MDNGYLPGCQIDIDGDSDDEIVEIRNQKLNLMDDEGAYFDSEEMKESHVVRYGDEMIYLVEEEEEGSNGNVKCNVSNFRMIGNVDKRSQIM